MACYCVARNKLIRLEITKPQPATVTSLWFWGLLACPELYCDWPVHNQHSWNLFGVHGFLSLTVNRPRNCLIFLKICMACCLYLLNYRILWGETFTIVFLLNHCSKLFIVWISAAHEQKIYFVISSVVTSQK